VPSDDSLAYNLYSAGFRPPRPSSGIGGKPYDSYHIEPCCLVCSEAIHLSKCSNSLESKCGSDSNRLLVDSCCTLSFIPSSVIPDNQSHKIYTPPSVTAYSTSGSLVQCTEAINLVVTFAQTFLIRKFYHKTCKLPVFLSNKGSAATPVLALVLRYANTAITG